MQQENYLEGCLLHCVAFLFLQDWVVSCGEFILQEAAVLQQPCCVSNVDTSSGGSGEVLIMLFAQLLFGLPMQYPR